MSRSWVFQRFIITSVRRWKQKPSYRPLDIERKMPTVYSYIALYSLLFVSRVELHAVTKTKALDGHDNLCDRKEKIVNPGHSGTPLHCLSANQYCPCRAVVTQGRTHRRETSTPREVISRTRYHQNGDISLTTLIDDFDWRLWLNALWFNALWFIALWLNALKHELSFD